MSGSLYYNYKGYYSTILMANAQANYETLYIDTGYECKVSHKETQEYVQINNFGPKIFNMLNKFFFYIRRKFSISIHQETSVHGPKSIPPVHAICFSLMYVGFPHGKYG